jgi:integrase
MAWVVKNNGTASFRGANSCRVSFQVENDATGEVKREMKTFRVSGQTQKEKKRCITEFRAELEGGLNRDARFLTFEEYASSWQRERANGTRLAKDGKRIAARTLSRDEARIRNINITLGKMRLVAITTKDIREFQSAIMRADETGKAPTVSGRPLSGASAHGIRTTLRQILQDAKRDNIISRNPCDDLPAPKVDTEERKPLSKERVAEFRALLDSATPRPSLVGFRLCLFAGLRRGEACGLRWSDFDPERGTITVRRSLCSQTLQFKEPKTSAGNRTIPLDAGTIAYLKRFKAIQAEKLLALGRSVEDSCIVCKSGCEYTHPENLTRSLIRFAKANGFEGVTPHILRHSYCTMLFAAKVDLKTVQYLMGHDDPATTLRVYTHYQEENGIEAASAIDALMDSLPTSNVIALEKPLRGWGLKAVAV